ncbi:hypothetical protein GT043_27390, partial [Streptomyces sp. SID2131]|nr:hypothetical protein [Streptomyces sp. SID2131]
YGAPSPYGDPAPPYENPAPSPYGNPAPPYGDPASPYENPGQGRHAPYDAH